MNLIMKIEDITIEHFNRSIKNENITVEMWDEEVLLQTDIYFYTENHDISPFIEEIKYRLIRALIKTETWFFKIL